MPRLRRPGSGFLAATLPALLLATATLTQDVRAAAGAPSNDWRQYCNGHNLNCRVHTPGVPQTERFTADNVPQSTTQGTATRTAFVAADGQVETQSLVGAAYEVEAGDLYLNDRETQLTDIATIHNGRTFTVELGLIWAEEVFVLNSTNLLLWEMFIDGVLSDSGEVDLQASRSLPTQIYAGEGSVDNSGTHTIAVQIRLDNVQSTSERNYQSFNKGASFAPLIVVLIFAMTTHMVELSLGLGVFVGACMVSGSITDGFKSTLDTYILEALASIDHGYVYLFALFMSGMVGLLEKSGGLVGITIALKRYVKTAKSAQIAGFCCGLIIFFDDYANTLVAGSSMRPLMDAFSVSREKLAFIVDATAAPIASIVPISSWVGFEVGLIQTELEKILEMDPDPTIATTGFGVFLETIKYRYYCIFMLMLMPLLIFSGRDMGPMLLAERRVRVYGRTDGGAGATLGLNGEKLTSANAPDPDTPCRWWNMALPIVMLVFYIFYLLIVTGYDGSGTQSFLDIMQLADSYSALLWGTMGGALTSYAFYLLQDKKDGRILWFNVKGKYHSFMRWVQSFKCCRRNKGQDGDGDDTNDDEQQEEKEHSKPLLTYREAMTAFLQGTEHIFGALVVLTLAWASGHIMVSVGLDRFFGELIVESDLDPRMLPTISFVISMLVAFATGTSWGTMTIMFPLMLVPSYVASEGMANQDVIFYGTTAGILAGAVAGDHASPISDTTVLSSLASECQLLEHVRTQAPYVLVVTLWSILVGTIPSGRGSYPNGVGIALGFVFMLFHTIFTSVKTINPSGRYDVFTELYLRCSKNEDLLALKADTVRAFETGGPLLDEADNAAGKAVDEGEEEGSDLSKPDGTGESQKADDTFDNENGDKNSDEENADIEQALEKKEEGDAEIVEATDATDTEEVGSSLNSSWGFK